MFVDQMHEIFRMYHIVMISSCGASTSTVWCCVSMTVVPAHIAPANLVHRVCMFLRFQGRAPKDSEQGHSRCLSRGAHQ